MGSLKEKAYTHICRKLMCGDLGPGARLSNRKLADEIGVSLIPVREAITQLAAEGLVDHRPGIGSFVGSISREELAELYDLREALECHAARSAAGRLRAQDLAVLRDCCARMAAVAAQVPEGSAAGRTADQVAAWRTADMEFHLTVFRAAGNLRALKIVQDLSVFTRMFARRWIDPPVGSSSRGSAEHIELVNALEAGRAEEAEAITRHHIHVAARDALDAYDRRRMQNAMAAAVPVR